MEIIVSVACGLALFWTCFFSMLVRNSFPGDGAGGADAPWLSLALRIAFFIGFGAMAFLSSCSEKGVPDKREITIAGVLVVLFALDTVVMSIAAHLGWTRPLAVDLFAWALMGTGLSSLFFLWLPHLSHMTDRAVAICLTLSACAGAVARLALNLMDPPGNTIFLAVCALASLGLYAALTEAFHVQGVKETEGEPADGGADGTRGDRADAVSAPSSKASAAAGSQGGEKDAGCEAHPEATASAGEGKSSAEPPEFIPAGMSSHAFAEQAQRIADALAEDAIPLDTSRVNAKLSWAFGTINIVYGIVFGLGAASITQLPYSTGIVTGIALVMILGALAACLFTLRTEGRVRQSAVLRMLFPVLVVALVPLSLFKDVVYLLCNLLLLGSYVFLVMVSIAFELRGARERKASPLYFVGMSQTTLSAGLALGFALGLLPSATGALDHAMLSIISLGLVVLLAVFVAFTQGRMTADQAATDAEKIAQRIAAERMLEEKLRAEEHPSKGRWKSSCESVAKAAGLSARETEVFMLLAKGRGIEHIQNKLCISGHTVKTHTYNIYRKMGIGSREELLDAIEAVGGSDSADDR